MNLREHRFQGHGGIEIYARCWTALGSPPRAIVVVAHGIAEHGGRYAHVARQLTEAGCAVFAIDHRGHGKSGGKRAFVDRFAHAVADMDQLVEIARTEYPKLPIILLGHSMGGALSLSYAIKHQEKLSALVLSGPAIALEGATPLLKALAGILSVLAPGLGLVQVDPSLVSRDPDEVERYAKDPLNSRGKLPVRTVAELSNFIQILPAMLPVLKLPLLIQHGSDDKLAGVSGSQMVIDKCGSSDKTLKVYEGLYHEIYNELAEDRAVVMKDLRDWILAHV